jgi:hypothetical protein
MPRSMAVFVFLTEENRPLWSVLLLHVAQDLLVPCSPLDNCCSKVRGPLLVGNFQYFMYWLCG